MTLLPALVFAILALLAFFIGWRLGSRPLGETRSELDRLRREREPLLTARTAFEQQASELRRQLEDRKQEAESLRERCAALSTDAARLEEQLKAGQAALQSERELLAQAREKLTDTFKSLAGDLLKENNQQFLGLASRELSAKEDSIKNLLTPVRETLGKMEAETRQLETRRAEAYSAVLTEIKNIQQTHESLRQETTQLVAALRAPKARGNWGELQLRRCIEFAGMLEHCSFQVEQHLRATEDDPAQRPDVIVQLPNGRAIIIDAKTPADAYLSAMGCTDEAEKLRHLTTHAAQVRTHLKQLGDKRYFSRFHNSPDFVVCFLPSEVLFSAALEQAPDLIECGSSLNVILATPTTLIALLKAVAYGWQQMEITRNAQAISAAGNELYRKLATMHGHFTSLGKALKASVDRFNDLVASAEGKDSVFDKAAKLHDLRIGDKDLAEIPPIELAVRNLKSRHWDEPISLAASAEEAEQAKP